MNQFNDKGECHGYFEWYNVDGNLIEKEFYL